MRIALIALGGFALALGLAFVFGRGVQALRTPDQPVVCPAMAMADRFTGHIAGLAHVDEPRGALLKGTAPGASTPGPEPLDQLTVIQGDNLYRIGYFTRTPTEPPNGYLLSVPIVSIETHDPVLFVTSACIPDHPLVLRVWTHQYDTSRRPDDPKDVQLVAWLRTNLPEQTARDLDPRILARATTAIPGCETVGVIGNHTADDMLAALVCLGPADSVVGTVLAPIPGARIDDFATVDLDGDGVEELIVRIDMPIQRSFSTNVTTHLLVHDPAAGFTDIDLQSR